mgnify:CR=1 FL=1
MDTYQAKTTKPARADQLSVAVVGAGISGLFAARTLADHGLEVRVFEKSRGPGGRSSTRREGEFSFDHGAQYFTVQDDRFRLYVDSWIDEGLVHTWQGRIGTAAGGEVNLKGDGIDRFVGVPGMSAVAGHLASELDIVYQTEVRGIEWAPNHSLLMEDSGEGLGSFNVVIVAMPPEQAAALLVGSSNLTKQVQSVKMLPTWAVMAVFDQAEPAGRALHVAMQLADAGGTDLVIVLAAAQHEDIPALHQRAAALAGDRPVEFQEIIRENTAGLLKQLRKFPAVQLVLGIPASELDSETITLLRSRSTCPVILVK